MANNTEDSSPRTTSERGLLNFSVPTESGNAWFSEEPALTKENIQIWKSQVLIPHSDSKHSYLGPIEKTEGEEVQQIFPCYKTHSPLILIFIQPDAPYDLKFLGTKVSGSS